VIGPSANRVILQSEVRVNGEYGIGGTFDEWKTLVAARAVGNPVMLFSMSAGFAGPLLKLCHADGTIFHFRGKSSIGKTKGALKPAGSIWGGPRFVQSWKMTGNGMEGAAALYNDGLLALDEISQFKKWSRLPLNPRPFTKNGC
jgi:putative DNA primase/helicase